MRYAWDQEGAYFGGGGGPVGALRRGNLAALRRWDAATANRVDHYLANSRFVAGRIERYYGRSAEVLPPPVDVEFFDPGPGTAARGHVLMVAALAPYKKVDAAIAACERLGVPLKVVGEGPERARLERLAGPSTELLGRVDAGRLRELYRGAICFLQPGIEDFGIAAVEALACGTPVVALGQGGVLDIVVDREHGVLFEDPSPEGLAAAIDKARRMEFNSMNLRGRAETFSADRFARGLRELLVSFMPDTEGTLL
jgi:glycosyltransferase involved in cell wall biosynthesis